MRIRLTMAVLSLVLLVSSCRTGGKTDGRDWYEAALEKSLSQLSMISDEVISSKTLPRAIWTGVDSSFISWQLSVPVDSLQGRLNDAPADSLLGTLRSCSSVFDWTSGFFPGSMWMAWHLSGNPVFRERAAELTALLYPVRTVTGTHDVGFMMNTSYGNAYDVEPSDSLGAILIQTADNLCTRFNQNIGCIRSWDFGKWNYPVIIDNMMNLELLFHVYHITGDSRYYDIACRHADTTLGNHFRKDGSTWHVVSYNDDGTIESKGTYQGLSDSSAWARGQAWGLYGYTLCFRETGKERYRDKARDIFRLISSRIKTDDLVPYWDYDAPEDAATPRDASAAAITASALLELSRLDDRYERKYLRYAEGILKSLSGPDYLAEPGQNCGFILMHSTGALPKGSEIDTPINYADYYYLEAMYRYKALKGL